MGNPHRAHAARPLRTCWRLRRHSTTYTHTARKMQRGALKQQATAASEKCVMTGQTCPGPAALPRSGTAPQPSRAAPQSPGAAPQPTP